MKARAATVGVVTALIGFGAGGSFALAGEFTPPKDKAKKEKAEKPKATPTPAASPSPGQSQYGTRPGKGCGDKNHVHTGPPGNPANKDCPPTAGSKNKKASTSKFSASCKKAIAKAKKKKASKRTKAKARSCRAKANKKARAKARAKAKAKKRQQAAKS